MELCRGSDIWVCRSSTSEGKVRKMVGRVNAHLHAVQEVNCDQNMKTLVCQSGEFGWVLSREQ